jgi:hypothetical protein
MAECTVQNVFDDVRSLLSDTQIAGGEIYTNNYLLTGYASGGVVGSGSLLGEPYRTMFSKLTGGSKRVRPTAYIVLPPNTTVVIPTTYNIVDFSEPEMIEECAATNAIAILSTDTSTPINVTTVAPHNLGPNGSMSEGIVSGIAGTPAPWGNWFATVTGTSTFSLNGSASDGNPGTSGFFYPASNQPFTEVFPTDFPAALDGFPQSTLGNYLWAQGRLTFRGATGSVLLRITYYASGTAPTNPNYVIWIDNCRDFLAHATACNAARSKQWFSMYEHLRNKAYGDPSHPEELSLLDLFYNVQVMADQRGPSRRQRPFRDRRYKWGAYLLG